MAGLQDVYRRRSSVLVQPVGGDYFLVPTTEDIGDLEAVQVINETAAAFYGRMDGTKPLGEIAREITSEFQVSFDTAASDLRGFANHMRQLGLLDCVGEEGGMASQTTGGGVRTYLPPQVDAIRVLEAGRAFYGALAKGCCSGAQRCPS
jgi:hypothetical protein